MAQPRGKSDLCEQQDVGEGRQWGARLSPIIPSGVDANPAWPCWNLLTALVTGASPKLFRYAVAGMSDKMLHSRFSVGWVLVCAGTKQGKRKVPFRLSFIWSVRD